MQEIDYPITARPRQDPGPRPNFGSAVVPGLGPPPSVVPAHDRSTSTGPVGPLEPPPPGRRSTRSSTPETTDHHGQDDQRTQRTDPLRSPDGSSSSGRVRDLTEPGYVRFPQSPRGGWFRITKDGRNLVVQDQIGFPVRVGRLRRATDRRGLVKEDQVGLPNRSRRHRATLDATPGQTSARTGSASDPAPRGSGCKRYRAG